jgi:hypothetical protein
MGASKMKKKHYLVKFIKDDEVVFEWEGWAFSEQEAIGFACDSCEGVYRCAKWEHEIKVEVLK